MSFSLAHLSDVHLGPLPLGEVFDHFRLKRLVGACSWVFKRRHIHSLEVSAAAVASIHAAEPDHIACTGDLLNISTWPDFGRAKAWLEKLGPPSKVSFVPGNHDAYVPVPWESGLAAFQPWMGSDASRSSERAFPYVRLRRNIALVGVNTACPQALHRAGGTVGAQQLRDLQYILETLQSQGFYRIVMIHHPPLPGLSRSRKALTDAEATARVLKEAGCELVLYGHNHHFRLDWIETASGPAAVIGAPSASGVPSDRHEAGGWNLFRIRRHQGRWQNEMTRYVWQRESRQFQPQAPALLLPP